MNNPDHISDSLAAIFWVEILKFLMRTRDSWWTISDPGWKKIRIRDNHPGPSTLLFCRAAPFLRHRCTIHRSSILAWATHSSRQWDIHNSLDTRHNRRFIPNRRDFPRTYSTQVGWLVGWCVCVTDSRPPLSFDQCWGSGSACFFWASRIRIH